MILFGKPQTESETTTPIDDRLTPLTELDATRIVGGQTPQMDIGITGEGGRRGRPDFDPGVDISKAVVGTAEI
ncbi:MAG: hypothetical protein V3S08_05870 [Phycisphaerales bacterium]